MVTIQTGMTIQASGMTRSTPFSYVCGCCSRCCYHKGISLDPYEVLRLARHQGVSTTEFIERYTDSAGTQLAQREDGACVFLGPGGCTVHADRPLVCRLYPLGQHLAADDQETFSALEPHPATEGKYGREGTIGMYLESQGAAPYLEAARLYLTLFRNIADRLFERMDRLAPAERETAASCCVRPAVTERRSPAWLDVDHVVDRYCRKTGIVKPAAPDPLMALHLKAVSVWADCPEAMEDS